MVGATEALVWAQSRLPALLAAGGGSGVLTVLVELAHELTDPADIWALQWSGSLKSPSITAFVAGGSRALAVPAPEEISRTIVGHVLGSARPGWFDDAASDPRFAAAESVVLRHTGAVGCLPVGRAGVLYLQRQEGRFSAEARDRLTALVALAGPVLDRTSATPAPSAARPVRPVPGMVGSAPAMGPLYDSIRAFGPMPWPALILGETGTGKELVARALHAASPRADALLVAVNCGAIPPELAESTLFGHEKGAFTGADRRREGLIERVGNGTLFLDEVGELPPLLQVKLLRLLQEGSFERVGGDRELKFSGRVIAATLRKVDDPQARGSFREDLYHRLAASVLRVPPLRDRREDIPTLAEHLVGRALAALPGQQMIEISEEAQQFLASQEWPGNVRELENRTRSAIARCLAAGDTVLSTGHFDGPAGRRLVNNLPEAVDAFQREQVELALRGAGGNRTKAAERLGVSRQWLYQLLAKWER